MSPSRRQSDFARTAASASSSSDALRMRDLVRVTGLPRETIHFYLAQGLLPKPLKTGRNTAVYGPEHLDRLQRIKDLQERHFLPLRAIKAVLDEGAFGGFSDEQESMLRRVRASMAPALSTSAAGTVSVSKLVPSRVSKEDFEEMKSLGLIEVQGKGRDAVVSEEDAHILSCWSDVQGQFTPEETEMTPAELAIYDEAIEALVDREAHLLTRRFTQMSGERAAELIESGEPIVIRLLAALRRKKIGALLRAIPSSDRSED
jgi:DNA-binding transcriptional MerR regulator